MSDVSNTRIAELIKTNPGYSAQVDLNLWFRDSAQNLATMRRYKPIASHRKAFEKIAGALDTKDKRVYLITGNYGTGKSHLCLMLSNYFAYPADLPDIDEFLKNYAEEDPAAGDKLRARRRRGRYLVALCDYDSTDEFGEVVLRAVLDPLRDAGLADVLETPYEEALGKLDALEAETKSGQALVDYYGLFQQLLPNYLAGVSMDAFKGQLFPGMDQAALEAFKRMHQEILRTPFTYHAGNLSAILRSTLRSEAFRERFEGIVILWDEFGYTLGEPSRMKLNVFQQFAQLCTEADPTRGKLVFIATAHKDFAAYAPSWAAEDYSKIRDRVEQVNLLPEGLEDVIGAVVSPDKNHALWPKVVGQATPMWGQWLPASKNSGVFDWLVSKPPVYRAKILEGVYPMHPMATYGIIQLAREVASQNRTVFTFFSSEKEDVFEEGSYLWFIHNHTIADAGGALSFYTVDKLFDYFATRLRTDNPDLAPKAKERVGNYEASRTQLQRARNQQPMELADVELIGRLMRTMLVYELIGVHNSLENLAFGLNAAPSERPVIETQLAELARFGIVHRNPTTQLYEFRRSDIFDVDQAVEEYKREHGDELGNLAGELQSLAPLKKKDQYLEAKGYNAQHGEDKQMDRRIVSPGDLTISRTIDGQELGYFEILEREVEQEVSKDGAFEGIVLYVLCETKSEISTARDLAAKNSSKRVIVALPTAPIAFKDAILNLKAIEHIRGLPEAEHFSTQDSALVGDRERTFSGKLEELRDQLLDPRKLGWYGCYGKAVAVDPHKAGDAATKVMQSLYTRRNAFSHDDFNLTHDVRNFTKKHLSIVEAVNALLNLGHALTIDQKQADNRGEKRYLERCLYQRGVLAQSRKQGSLVYVEVERDLAKFEPNLPALADMIRDISQLDEAGRLGLRSFITKYRQPPYGLGNIALSILLATLLRYFGDTIKIKKDDAAIGDLYVADFETVSDIAKGIYPDAFIKFREIRAGERELINGVYALFAGPASAAQSGVTTTNAYDAVTHWFDALAPVAQVGSFYQGSQHVMASRLLLSLERIRAQDPHAFVLGELQTILEYEADELVTSERAKEILDALRKAKDQVESTLEQVQSAIRDGLCDIFGVQGSTWDDVAEGVRDWYNELDSNQRSTTAPWHNDASKPLAQLFLDLSNPRELFVDKLPERPSYNYGRVRDWNADLSAGYLAKIRDGVRHIEENRIKVASLDEPELVGNVRREGRNVFFSGPLTLHLSHPDPTVRVYVTDTGNDPISETKERSEFQGSRRFDIQKLTQARRTGVTVRYVPQDPEGNWGVVETLTFIDETLENEIRAPVKLIKESKTVVKFVFPVDKAGFVTACKTFLESILQHKILNQVQLREVVEQILDELDSQAKE